MRASLALPACSRQPFDLGWLYRSTQRQFEAHRAHMDQSTPTESIADRRRDAPLRLRLRCLCQHKQRASPRRYVSVRQSALPQSALPVLRLAPQCAHRRFAANALGHRHAAHAQRAVPNDDKSLRATLAQSRPLLRRESPISTRSAVVEVNVRSTRPLEEPASSNIENQEI